MSLLFRMQSPVPQGSGARRVGSQPVKGIAVPHAVMSLNTRSGELASRFA
ncbi:hypothetical protein GGE46_001042 [Rhizobium etli]|uniref:Uncharacterized protein n=1 Tax=Rhizobium etli TaxID=29449 RepID=A0A7W7ED00_RHIET|nr:hypothetical protein [Rhizobium etli]MBB4534333.1 hypothetical protein [Rhizobium etli]